MKKIRFEHFNNDGLTVHCAKQLSDKVSAKIRNAVGVDRVIMLNRYSVILKLAYLIDSKETEAELENILREENYLE